MAKLGALALAGIAAASFGWARAADLPPAPSLPPSSPAEAEFGGWYLRGDLGVGVNSTAPELKAAAAQTFDDATLTPFGMIDLGAGYQLNGWFRTDATLEYRAGADLHFQYAATGPASPAFGGQAQYADFARSAVTAIVGLINGYANLGSWYGLSPFLGAGAGFADNRLSGFTERGIGYAANPTLGPIGYANGTRTSFAWALMAGVDFDLTPNIKLELGYRYLSYGSFSAGGATCGGTFSANCNGSGANTISSRNRLASNDFRLGLIYLIGEAPPAPVVAH
jgi:opacity protein-like surface antigen